MLKNMLVKRFSENCQIFVNHLANCRDNLAMLNQIQQLLIKFVSKGLSIFHENCEWGVAKECKSCLSRKRLQHFSTCNSVTKSVSIQLRMSLPKLRQRPYTIQLESLDCSFTAQLSGLRPVNLSTPTLEPDPKASPKQPLRSTRFLLFPAGMARTLNSSPSYVCWLKLGIASKNGNLFGGRGALDHNLS